MPVDVVEIEDGVDSCLDTCEEGVTRVDNPISYNEFFGRFLIPNKPCIFGKFISDNWPSRTDWVDGTMPNWSYIQDTFGEIEAPVADCGEREYNAQKKTTYTVRKYIEYLKNYRELNYPQNLPNLYLKDWHLTRDYPNMEVYRVPPYFACDWLNEYFSSRADIRDDYRFVYMGPKGSWTPLHADVFTSYSWSVNVVGRKRWILFPPGQENFMKDRLGNLAYDVADLSDEVTYPNYAANQDCYEVIQEAGEGIFVPSGWHHQVWNLEDTISINHNWINACNIKHMWAALHSHMIAVQHEVNDCRDMDGWEEHCQIMLRASHGMNYEEFYDLLLQVAEPRMAQLIGDQALRMFGDWVLGQTHAVWDLRQVLTVLENFLEETDLQCLPWVSLKQPSKLKENISRVLQTFSNLKKKLLI